MFGRGLQCQIHRVASRYAFMDSCFADERRILLKERRRPRRVSPDFIRPHSIADLKYSPRLEFQLQRPPFLDDVSRLEERFHG